jgi:class 3 adenylate cyclase
MPADMAKPTRRTHLGHPPSKLAAIPGLALIVRWLSSARGHLVTGERVERRLAAVLAADVAGYSRLMGADEAGKVTKPCEQRHAVAAAAGRHVP